MFFRFFGIITYCLKHKLYIMHNFCGREKKKALDKKCSLLYNIR